MIAQRALAFLALPLVSFACGSDARSAPTGEPVGQTRQAILRGTTSDDSQDAVVMLLHHDPVENKRVGICTGALVAPRLVLTARHCLARVNPAQLACDVDGTPLKGGDIAGNWDAANFYVFTGRIRPEFTGEAPPSLDPTKWKARGQGIEIVDDKSGTLCNHDLAFLLLKDPIEGVPLASIRLDREIAIGEKLVTVGWGVSSGEIEPKERQQRADVVVRRVGPDTQVPTLTKSEFLFGESICLGDSGGPVFSQETNAIIGVVSRGGNGADPSGGGPAYTCDDADNVATKVAPFRELAMDAFSRAGAEPKLEPKPEDDGCCVSRVGGRGPETRHALGLAVALVAVVRRRGRRPRSAI